jgi:hypothetical protein
VEEERDLTEGQLVVEEVVAVSSGLGTWWLAVARGGAPGSSSGSSSGSSLGRSSGSSGFGADLGHSGFRVGLASAEELDA